MMRAVLVRNFNLDPVKEAPVAFDPDNDNRGYLLGRLFAAYEQIQQAALGSVNTSIKDKYYGSAAAQPQKVFAMLETGSAPHLSKLGKQKPGAKVNLEKLIIAIMTRMSPGENPFPVAPSQQEQALFDRVRVNRNVDGAIREIDDRRLSNVSPARKFADYSVAIDRDNLPGGVEIIERL